MIMVVIYIVIIMGQKYDVHYDTFLTKNLLIRIAAVAGCMKCTND